MTSRIKRGIDKTTNVAYTTFKRIVITIGVVAVVASAFTAGIIIAAIKIAG